MKNNYIALWLLLALALIIVTVVSFFGDINIGDKTLKKSPIADVLINGKQESDSLSSVATLNIDSVSKLEEPCPVDSTPQRLFIFGDSMTFNLALRLAKYAQQNGHEINSVNWDSSNTRIWAQSDTLKYYLDKYKPTQVFISLGSNELYVKNPENLKPYITHILEMIDTIPYVWIGPPNWKKDGGINDLLQATCKPGTFFRTDGMQLDRKKDHIHPTKNASALWVDSIMRWLPSSAHPFVAEFPSDSIAKANPHIVFLKALNK